MDPKRVAEWNKIAEDDTYGNLSPADRDKYINVDLLSQGAKWVK